MYEIKPDGPAALVVLKHGNLAGHILRTRRTAARWKACTVTGHLAYFTTLSAAADFIKGNAPPT